MPSGPVSPEHACHSVTGSLDARKYMKTRLLGSASVCDGLQTCLRLRTILSYEESEVEIRRSGYWRATFFRT